MREIKMKKIVIGPVVPFCLAILFAFLFFSALSRGSMPASASAPNKPDSAVEPAAKKAAKASWAKYQVQKGDCLNAIAGRYLVHVYQIKQWNGLKSDLLRPGQVLQIKEVKWPVYRGKASWYGPGFHGQPMANGEIYDMNDIVAAHRNFPLGTLLKITNLDNKRALVAPVLDRGPYTKKNGVYDREVDLSFAAAKILGAIEPGVIPVKIEPLNL
jgi:rare lipoprotein A (peptidoglycan hydrolase)